MMDVYILFSMTEGQEDQIEGVFSTPCLCDAYADSLKTDPNYDGCTLYQIVETMDYYTKN